MTQTSLDGRDSCETLLNMLGCFGTAVVRGALPMAAVGCGLSLVFVPAQSPFLDGQVTYGVSPSESVHMAQDVGALEEGCSLDDQAACEILGYDIPLESGRTGLLFDSGLSNQDFYKNR